MKRPDPPQPDKPLAEMTPKELAVFRAKLRREIRDRQIATGMKKPKTMREMEIWTAARTERDERQARRIARAERTGSDADTEQREELLEHCYR